MKNFLLAKEYIIFQILNLNMMKNIWHSIIYIYCFYLKDKTYKITIHKTIIIKFIVII